MLGCQTFESRAPGGNQLSAIVLFLGMFDRTTEKSAQLGIISTVGLFFCKPSLRRFVDTVVFQRASNCT